MEDYSSLFDAHGNFFLIYVALFVNDRIYYLTTYFIQKCFYKILLYAHDYEI